MSSIVISGDTSGAITLAAPAVAGTNTITLPASTGTVLTTGSPQSGGVIQVVNATYSSGASNSTNTYADTGLTASITPKFSTSKVLVIVEQAGIQKSTSDTYANLKLQRNGSDLIAFSNGTGYNGTIVSNYVGNSGATYLDSPATTSSTTYKTVFNSGNNNASVTCQANGSVSTITLMEIAV